MLKATNTVILRFFTLILILNMICSVVGAKVIYVDDDAIGTNDGSSWENAYIYLQDALADADSVEKPVEIRIAQGTYKPDHGTGQILGDRYASFLLINDVTLSGGYAGIFEPDPNERDYEKYETILSGDLDGNDINVNDPGDLLDEPTRSDNSKKVVNGSSTDQTAVLDGFTITGGCNKTFVIDVLDGGGGIFISYGSPTIKNCTLIGNSTNYFGGGLLNTVYSNPIITNCIFINNYAERGGGGVCNENSSPIFSHCSFKGNYAIIRGGAMDNLYDWVPLGYEKGSNPKITNCIFSGNYVRQHGGGIHFSEDCNSVIINCSFNANFAKNGRALSYDSENTVNYVQLNNCILWDGGNEIYNPNGSQIIIDYTNLLGGVDSIEDPCNAVIWGIGNINVDPLFANPGYWADVNDPNIIVEPNDPNAVWIEGDYHLKSEAGRWDPNSKSWIIDDVQSPCIDAGDPNSPIGDELFPNGGRINMGAYGGTREASMSLETGGLSLPDIAFICLNETEPAQSFRALLESYGCPTTLIKTKNVTATLLESCDIIIVADDTFYTHAWTEPNAIAAIENSGKPIVGLGHGGYDFFGLLGLSIGSPYGGYSTFSAINVIDPNNSLFCTPYPIDIPLEGMLQLYTTEILNTSIYLWPDIPETITVFGSQINDYGYFPLVMEQNRYFLWGFTESPEKMTDIGKRLFINTVIWMANAGWESGN